MLDMSTKTWMAPDVGVETKRDCRATMNAVTSAIRLHSSQKLNQTEVAKTTY
jgi:hypothetical protein